MNKFGILIFPLFLLFNIQDTANKREFGRGLEGKFGRTQNVRVPNWTNVVSSAADPFAAFYFYDQFDDVNGTNITAHTPDKAHDAGPWGESTTPVLDIQGNILEVSTCASAGAVWPADTADNYTASVEFRYTAATSSDIGIFFRVSDLSNATQSTWNGWFCGVLPTGNTLRRWRYVNGSAGVSVGTVAFTPSQSTWYRIFATVSGTSITCRVEAVADTSDNATLSLTSSTHQAETHVGVYGACGTGGTYEYNNFYMELN